METENFTKQVPDGDTHERDVCTTCGFIDYVNPRIVVGSVVRHEGKILLCKRAIEPRSGYWTLPAGYLELNETPENGAIREAQEEACADLIIDSLLAVYAVPHISQVQLMYRAHLQTPHFAAGPESLDVQLFDWDDIPWEDLAFPSVHWALKQDLMVEMGEAIGPFKNPE
ncbi:MAG: NUDIX hydrolase [Hyphomicrobiales bacterium]